MTERLTVSTTDRINAAMKDYAVASRNYQLLRKEQEVITGNWQLAKAAEERSRQLKHNKEQEVADATSVANRAMDVYLAVCKDEASRLAHGE